MAKNNNELAKKCLKSPQKLAEYLAEKGEEHDYYKWYSTLEKIEKCMKDKYILLSTGSDWNDPVDAKRFNRHSGYVRYGKCFSFSRSENVAMWLLYAQDGRTDKNLQKAGAMMNITLNRMDTFIKVIPESEVRIGALDKKGKFVGEPIALKKEWIAIRDVLYVGKGRNEDTRTIKRSTEVYDGAEEDQYENEDIIIKDYAWSYENECRLVITIPEIYLRNYEKHTHMRISISDDFAEFLKKRIILAPNCDIESEYPRSTLQMRWKP